MLHKRVLEQLNRFCQKKKKKKQEQRTLVRLQTKITQKMKAAFAKYFPESGFFRIKILFTPQ